MSYEILERQIRSLPDEAMQELSHYVTYLTFVYNSKKDNSTSISEQISEFMQKNPNAFDEFSTVQDAGLESIRKLTKDDAW